MKVARLTAPGRFVIGEEETPVPGPGQVLVKVTRAAICGSDLHYFRHGGLGSHPAPLPMDSGHEAAGRVVRNGEGAHLSEGQLVAIDPLSACGRCVFCLAGRFNLCQRQTYLGASAAPGAFREYLVVPAHQLLSITGCPDDWAAMLEPLGIALYAVVRARVRQGQTIAVFGAGAIGLCIAAAAKLAGARHCILHDPLGYRLDFAKKILGDFIIALRDDDLAASMLAATAGHGAEACFEAAGTKDALARCIRAASPGGVVALVGITPNDTIAFNPHQARIKELDLVNVRRSNLRPEEWQQAALALPFPLDALVTHRFPLSRIQDAFTLAANHSDGVIRAVLTP